jgi:hypothetical protein
MGGHTPVECSSLVKHRPPNEELAGASRPNAAACRKGNPCEMEKEGGLEEVWLRGCGRGANRSGGRQDLSSMGLLYNCSV